MKPLIAITMNFSSEDIGSLTHLGAKEQEWSFIATSYALAVEKAGGIPVLVPSYSDITTSIELIKRCDGVLLSGGGDITPLLYNEDITAQCGRIEAKRDKPEIAMVKALLEDSDIPVLGICRGCQLLNVAAGGTLYQNIGENGREHMLLSVSVGSYAHKASVQESSKLFAATKASSINVNSYHHQAVKDIAKGFSAVSRAEDGIVEAIEKIGDRFILGVQWHPEMLSECKVNENIFTEFIKSCKK